MALFDSQIISAASGSVGGLTFSRNAGGAYVRARAVPTNPATDRQTAVRTALGSANQSWDLDLTDDQQNAWNVYGKNTPVVNSLGKTVHRSGHAWYVAQYVLAVQLGADIVFDAPTSYNTGSPPVAISGFGIQHTAGPPAHNNLVADVSVVPDAPVEGTLALYIGRPQNHGRRFYKGPYQLATATDLPADSGAASFDVDVTTLFSSYPFAVGNFQPIRLRILYSDGRVSQDFASLQEVVAIT